MFGRKTARESQTEYGTSRGLFGETDRDSGEYHFKSGYTQQVYSNARYVPADEDAVPPRYYKPSAEDRQDRFAHEKERGRRKRTGLGFLAVLLLCLCCAVIGGLAGAAIMSSFLESRISALERSTTEISAAEDEILNAESLRADSAVPAAAEPTVSDLYDKACTEVVGINTEYYYQDRSGYTIPGNVSGSGFVVSSDGYIVTNYHVVEKAVAGGYQVSVAMYDGSYASGSVVGYERDSDIAIVKVDSVNMISAPIGDSSEVRVGDDIFAVGNPFGVLEFTLSCGRVSALDRLIATENNENAIPMFQIDAAVFEGNSGGPVYNSRGEVIGIVSAKYSPDVDSEGIGFAIPINSVRSIIDDLMKNGHVSGKAALGITFDDRYNSMYSMYYGLPAGAYVYSVIPGSCADRSGIRSGDIIIQIDNSVVGDFNDVSKLMKRYTAGSEVMVILSRSGEMLATKVVLDEAVSGASYDDQIYSFPF